MSHIDKNEINHLVKQVGMGNDNAFELLYSKMKDVLYYFLLKRNLNVEDIKDIISETFSTVIVKSRTKMLYTNCFGWIIGIAKNKVNNFNRKNKNVIYDSEAVDSFATSNSFNSISIRYEIGKFDDFSKQVLRFVFYDDFSCEETAKLLNVSASTIKRRKKEIQIHFKEDYKDD